MEANPNRGRIFLVDDEAVIVEVIGNAISKLGYEVHPFTEPVKALAAARDLEPDLLFSGVIMPEMSGVELAREMTSLRPRCRVLLMSGRADELRQAGIGIEYRILTKPFRFTDLERFIAEALA